MYINCSNTKKYLIPAHAVWMVLDGLLLQYDSVAQFLLTKLRHLIAYNFGHQRTTAELCQVVVYALCLTPKDHYTLLIYII